MRFSRSLRFLVPLLTTATLGQAHAFTYTWLGTNSTGGNNQWFQRGNYAEFPAPDNGGTFTTSNNDTLIFDAGTRNASVNTGGQIGLLVIGPNFGTEAANANLSGSGTLNIDSGGTLEPGDTAGIIVLSGRTIETNINARLNLTGDATIANFGTSRLRIGVGNGAGGLDGSGTLAITKGVVLLPATTAAHTYSGAITVNDGGVLQANGGSTFNTYSSLSVGNNGSIAGGGTFGGAVIHSGGRVSPGGEGNSSAGPGTLTFTNLLEFQSTGLLVIDIKSSGVDSIDTTAGGVILGGELRLRLDSAYTGPGSTYDVILGIGPASGNFGSVTIQTGGVASTSLSLTDNSDGTWSGSYTALGYDILFDAKTGKLSVAAVPEPAQLLLSAMGAFALLRRRR